LWDDVNGYPDITKAELIVARDQQGAIRTKNIPERSLGFACELENHQTTQDLKYCQTSRRSEKSADFT